MKRKNDWQPKAGRKKKVVNHRVKHDGDSCGGCRAAYNLRSRFQLEIVRS